MRYGWISALIFAVTGFWGTGCSYTIDKSFACENEPYAAEGYGNECETDEDCDKKGKEAKVCFNEEYMGLDQLFDTEAMPDGGINIGGALGGSDIVTQLLGMVEEIVGTCTKGDACAETGCALCYLCCNCRFSIGDLVPELAGFSDEEVGFTSCVPSDIGEQLSMLCACGENLTQLNP